MNERSKGPLPEYGRGPFACGPILCRMRALSLAFLLLASVVHSFGQDRAIDSLRAILRSSIPDSARISSTLALSGQYYRTAPEQARALALQAKELAEKTENKSGLAQ